MKQRLSCSAEPIRDPKPLRSSSPHVAADRDLAATRSACGCDVRNDSLMNRDDSNHLIDGEESWTRDRVTREMQLGVIVLSFPSRGVLRSSSGIVVGVVPLAVENDNSWLRDAGRNSSWPLSSRVVINMVVTGGGGAVIVPVYLS